MGFCSWKVIAPKMTEKKWFCKLSSLFWQAKNFDKKRVFYYYNTGDLFCWIIFLFLQAILLNYLFIFISHFVELSLYFYKPLCWTILYDYKPLCWTILYFYKNQDNFSCQIKLDSLENHLFWVIFGIIKFKWVFVP